MKQLELKATTKCLEPIARVNLTPIRHSFYEDGGSYGPIEAIFNSLGIKLSSGQEEYINSRFTYNGKTPKKRAVVKADSGNYKEYLVFMLSNQLYIEPMVTDYVVLDLEEFDRLSQMSESY